MNKAKFDSFSTELQQAILDSAKEAGNYQRQLNLENEKDIITKLQKAGIEVIEEVDNKPFKAIIEEDVRKAFIEKNGSELVEKIDGLAK